MASLDGYNSEQSIQHYTKAVALGLNDHELELRNLLLSSLCMSSSKNSLKNSLKDSLKGPSKKLSGDSMGPSAQTAKSSVLVIGCGCGREAFAFERLGHTVTGIDQSRELLSQAQALGHSIQSQVRFEVANALNYSRKNRFDFVWLTAGLTGHILGRASRVAFFAQMKQITNSVVYLPDVYPKPWSSQFENAHQKLKQQSSDIERGDTLRDRFAKSLKFEEPVKYHFYLSQKEAVDEFKDAGWHVDKYNEVGYVIKTF